MKRFGNILIDLFDWAFMQSGFGWREWRSLGCQARQNGTGYFREGRS